jgi:hypothetical protein
MNDGKKTKELIISYFFPKYSDTGGIVIAKRIISKGKKVDVLQNYIENLDQDESFNNFIEDYINRRIILHAPYENIWMWDSIKPFITEGMEQLNRIKEEEGIYNSIYSRSMPRQSHLLAFEYKIENPETKWVAEFSDPIIFDIYGKERIKSKINDDKFINKVNNIILKNDLLKKNNIIIELDPSNVSTEYLCELLPFLFADEIIFTNENQRKIMMDKFPLKGKGNINNLKKFVLNKSKICPQPTLQKDAYNITPSEYKINPNYVNFAYFGHFYGTRNFEDVFYAFENINDSLKNRYKLHIFTSETAFITQSISNFKMKDNIIINNSLPYLEFLNLSTKFDVLIITDAHTQNYFEINPYLPSKLADYIGSGSDIWSISEKGSVLYNNENIKYKSTLGDFLSSKYMINKIIKEKIEDTNTNEDNNFDLIYSKFGDKTNFINSLDNKSKIYVLNLYEVINFLDERNMQLTNDLNKKISSNHEKDAYINKLEKNLRLLNEENNPPRNNPPSSKLKKTLIKIKKKF